MIKKPLRLREAVFAIVLSLTKLQDKRARMGPFLYGLFNILPLTYLYERVNELNQQDTCTNQDCQHGWIIKDQPVNTGKGQEEQTGSGMAQSDPPAGWEK